MRLRKGDEDLQELKDKQFVGKSRDDYTDDKLDLLWKMKIEG